MTAVTTILFPQTMGEDQPLPGIAVFQTTFLVVLQVCGSPFPSATPACWPRNCGQWSAAVRKADCGTASRSPRTKRVRMRSSVPCHSLHEYPSPESHKSARYSHRGHGIRQGGNRDAHNKHAATAKQCA